MNQRELRGFDRRRLYTVLSEATVATLQAMLATIEEAAPGPKDAVVLHTVATISDGHLAIRDALREAPKPILQRMCAVLELDDRGTIDVLVDRLDRAVRFGPFGDADETPPSTRSRLPSGLDEREMLFALELHARLARRSRGATSLTLGELIGRIGRRTAVFRARSEATRDAGTFLWSIGIAASPDLRAVAASPGIEAEVQLSVRADWLDADVAEIESAAQPTPPSTLNSAERCDDLAADIAVLGMGVARVDDVVHPDEEALVRAYARRRAASPAIAALLSDLQTNTSPLDEVARRVATRLDAEKRSSLLEHLCDVALADGVLVPEEVDLLRRLSDLFGVSFPQLDELVHRFGASASASKQQYRSAHAAPSLKVAEASRASGQASAPPSVAASTVPTGNGIEGGPPPAKPPTPAEQHVDEIISLLFE
ncbi:MAG: TerB family tellurite resistance protein [Deltaproteobacteria bacterium]|nr:TerB family tellurite resistance protein [Deltaproteobacteria bacterium]